ncbi:MAG: hypothetical protein ACPLRM_02050 [Anaerolineae bacterium]
MSRPAPTTLPLSRPCSGYFVSPNVMVPTDRVGHDGYQQGIEANAHGVAQRCQSVIQRLCEHRVSIDRAQVWGIFTMEQPPYR